jgi:hypothetical protein
MDIITGLPKSEGNCVIMVIVDRLTKYTHFCALSHPLKSSTVATTFMDTVQKLHVIPNIIVSDRDPIFTGHFLTQPAPHRANCSHQDLLILSGPKSQCSSFRISGIRTSGVRVSREHNSHAPPNPEPRNSEALDSCHLSAMINGS